MTRPSDLRNPRDIANTRQVGGEHYQSEYQHWDFVERNGLGYLEGCATKYATRYRKKSGLEDLEKAIHYVEKLLELHREGIRLPRTMVDISEIFKFCAANDLNQLAINIVTMLSRWSHDGDLLNAIHNIKRLIEKVKEDE